MQLEKCPDKSAYIEFSLKTTLVSANATGQDNLSQMSDVLSAYDSGPESEFDFNDFLEEGKDGGDPSRSAIAKIRSKINRANTVVKTHIKQSADPTRPPLMIGKQVPTNSDMGGIDADSIIEQSKKQNSTEATSYTNPADDLRSKIDAMRKIRVLRPPILGGAHEDSMNKPPQAKTAGDDPPEVSLDSVDTISLSNSQHNSASGVEPPQRIRKLKQVVKAVTQNVAS